MSDAEFGGHWGKRSTGMGEKPSDRWAVPLCRPTHTPNSVVRAINPDAPRRMVDIGCHGRQHGHEIGFLDQPKDEWSRNYIEVQFWKKVRKNPFQIADTLYRDLGSGESAYRKPRRDKKPRKKQTTIKPKGFGEAKRKIQSKGFDTTKTRKMDGTTRPRKPRKTR